MGLTVTVLGCSGSYPGPGGACSGYLVRTDFSDDAAWRSTRDAVLARYGIFQGAFHVVDDPTYANATKEQVADRLATAVRTEHGRTDIAAATALQRSLAHTSQHVGQIILLAKAARGADWQTLSIPRGQSQAFTEQLAAKARVP